MSTRVIYIILIMSLILASCAAYQTDGVEKIDYVGTTHDCLNKPSVSYAIAFKSQLSATTSPDKDINSLYIYGDNKKELFREALLESGAFKSVIENDKEADIFVNITSTRVIGKTGSNMVTALSLGLIPTQNKYRLDISGSATQRKKTINFNYYDEITEVIGLLLLPVGIFQNQSKAEEDITYYRFMMIANKIINEIQKGCNTAKHNS